MVRQVCVASYHLILQLIYYHDIYAYIYIYVCLFVITWSHIHIHIHTHICIYILIHIHIQTLPGKGLGPTAGEPWLSRGLVMASLWLSCGFPMLLSTLRSRPEELLGLHVGSRWLLLELCRLKVASSTGPAEWDVASSNLHVHIYIQLSLIHI